MFKLKLSLVLAVVALVCLTVVAFAQQSRYTLPGERVFPEGIAYRPSTGDYYVSSTTDGTILKGNINQPAASVFIPGGTEGLTGPRGMKVDDKGRLLVCGGPQAMIFVFDATTGRFINKFSTGVTPSFCNDVTVTPDGKAYFTDSQSPFIYRLGETAQGALTLEKWIDVSPVIKYQTGFNLGGIDHSADGRYLIVAQGNVGKLFRIDTNTKDIREIDLAGETVRNADGIWLEGQTLWVVRNAEQLVVTIQMANDFASGKVMSSVTDASLGFPTTLAKAGNRLLIVNAQFDKQRANQPPSLPFSVSSIPVPATIPTALPTTGAEPIGTITVLLGIGVMLLVGGILIRRSRPAVG